MYRERGTEKDGRGEKKEKRAMQLEQEKTKRRVGKGENYRRVRAHGRKGV